MAHRPEFNAEKFRELVLYVAWRSVDDPGFDTARLGKILCYSDFLCYAFFGEPLTGATYLRRPQGPMPRELKRARQELFDQGDAVLLEAPYLQEPRRRVLALRDGAISLFSQRELVIVNQVIADLRAARTAEGAERQLLGWQVTRDGEEIVYDTIFLSDKRPTEDDVRWAQEVAKEHGLLRPA